MSEPVKQGKKDRYLLKFIVKIGIFALIAAAILIFVITFRRVSGNNMFPSIRDGDLCILYKLGDYHMGDVVYYKCGDTKKFGRIVATEGQEIDFPEEGGYLLNGFVPSEEIVYQTFKDEDDQASYPRAVGNGCFYVMNDFRSDTKDSRKTGDVQENDIIGKVVYVLRRRGF